MDVMLAPPRSATTEPARSTHGLRAAEPPGLLTAGLGLGFLLFALSAAGTFGPVPAWSLPWIPTFGVDLSFRLDGLSVLFGLMITGVGALVALYAAAYMRSAPMTGRFHLTIGLFALAMVGLVTADDVITLFVFWEITSLTSFLLVGTDPRSEKTRKAALQALLVTVGGGLALLAGLILLSLAAGSTSLSGLVATLPALGGRADVQVALALVVVGCAAKSAQFPLHFWLPNAMAAPTPVSAFLHSATMVKAGVYLLARLDPGAAAAAIWWNPLLAVLGLTTMTVGALLALRQTDLKKLLAYSTVVALGTLVALIGVDGAKAAVAFVTFLVVHALYKAALFFVAGIVDHETGTRDTTRLGGLRALMPVTAAAALVASLSMAGLPPMMGFLGKELVYEAKLGVEGLSGLTIAVAVGVNAIMVAVAAMVAWHPFAGTLVDTPKTPHEAPWPMLVGPVLLAALCVVFGTLPWLIEDAVLLPAAAAVHGAPIEASFALWHGFNTVLVLSVATLALGVLVFLRWETFAALAGRLARFDRAGPERGYEASLAGLLATAARATDAIQGGRLRVYVLILLSVAGAAVGLPLVLGGGLDLATASAPSAGALALALLAAGGAIGAIVVRGILPAVLSLGALGLGMALLFLMLGAPDLAFTQFAVEALFVIVLAALMIRLRVPQEDPRTRTERRTDAVAAGVAGLAAAALLAAVMAEPFAPHLGEWFGRTSMPEAFGQNVVNVIIVDFRALDTLGEIAVVAFAAMGVWALARGQRLTAKGGATASPMVTVGVRLVVPLLLVFAAWILLRGHNAPGGGFIGGLIATSAVALTALARGAGAARRMLRAHPAAIAAAGVGIAALSGLPALLAGASPFLTHLWWKPEVMGVTLPLGTALVFDLGVFLVVVGGASAMVLGLMGRNR
ncbi:MAG: hydrogen gas-evolving membrane-bound hydrogenase subunit E [Rhodospirillales bacterium]